MATTKTQIEDHLRWFFPTPIVAYPWPECAEVNDALRALILETEQSADPRFRNVVGGWSTAKHFLTWDAPCIRALSDHVDGLIWATVEATTQGRQAPAREHFSMQSWANVLRSGGYHAPHTHGNSFWSGVYYVSVGKAEGETPYNGYIELFDPRSATGAIGIPGSIFQSKCRINPEPGLTLLFPSWLKHMVHPFKGEGERISVSFNLVRGSTHLV